MARREDKFRVQGWGRILFSASSSPNLKLSNFEAPDGWDERQRDTHPSRLERPIGDVASKTGGAIIRDVLRARPQPAHLDKFTC
jgi:hypothetical protein